MRNKYQQLTPGRRGLVENRDKNYNHSRGVVAVVVGMMMVIVMVAIVIGRDATLALHYSSQEVQVLILVHLKYYYPDHTVEPFQELSTISLVFFLIILFSWGWITFSNS